MVAVQVGYCGIAAVVQGADGPRTHQPSYA